MTALVIETGEALACPSSGGSRGCAGNIAKTRDRRGFPGVGWKPFCGAARHADADGGKQPAMVTCLTRPCSTSPVVP
jgi:hypothetical protein